MERKTNEQSSALGQTLSHLIAAFSIGALQIGVAVSLAVLVFGNELSNGVPRAAIAYVAGTGLVTVIVGSATRMPVAISGAQDTPAIVAAAVAVGIAADVSGDAAVSTTMVAIAIAGLTSAVLFFGIGRARLGEAARSVPFTVISGFMAGTGWLLLRGGIEVMSARPLEPSRLADFATWEIAQYWLPGLALASVIVYGLIRGLPSVVFGLLMLGSAAAIHLVGRLGWSFEALENNNWLIGPFPDTGGYSPITVSDLEATDWSALSNQILPLAGLATVSLLGLVLNLTGLEVALEADVDIDRELELAGGAAAASAVAGGMVGYHLLGDTVIADRLQARGRVVPILIGGMCLITVLIGTSVVAQMPRAVAGGVLAAAGINLLIGWVVQLRAGFSRLDSVLSALVLIAIIAFGVLTGIAAGVVAAVIVFVISYGKLPPVRRVHRMDTMDSNIDRPAAHQAALLEHNDAVAVLELDGYLFFGSLRAVTDEITPMLRDELRYLILDFRSVRGVDSSVVAGLVGIERRAISEGVTIVWSHLRPEIAQNLARESSARRHTAPDVDRALEWVEEQILAEVDLSDVDLIDHEWLDAIERYGERLEVAAGQTLIEADDSTRRIFAIVSGSLTAWGESAGKEWIRYRRVGPGSFLGEIAFTTGAPRSAMVAADVDSVVIALAPEGLVEMEASDPALASMTNRLIASRLAERLATTSKSVRNLSS